MKIKLGFEVGTGKQIDIQLSHLIATGITQLAGKTVTLESLIKRSNLKAVVFKTKIGERGFSEGRKVAPFFRQRSDYEFVKSLIEAYSREKLFIEKGTLMELCKGSKDLLEIKNRIDTNLANEKIKGIKREIYIRLQHYLENLIPQIQYANFSSTLQVDDGINIMDLEKYSEEAQSLIIQSVVAEVLNTQKNTLVVIPECFTANTPVIYEDGNVKEIKQVKNGDSLIGGRVYDRFYKYAKIIEVTGATIIQSSYNHPYLVIPKESIHYDSNSSQRRNIRALYQLTYQPVTKLAKDLQKGDYMLVPENIPHKTLYYWTKEQLGFVALIASEGNLHNNEIRVAVKEDVEWITDVFSKGAKAFGYKYRVSIGMRGETIFSILSKDLTDILCTFGLNRGKKAHIIDIPSQIFYSPLESIARFIDVYLCGDGHIGTTKSPKVQINSASLKFLRKMRLLLMKFGVISTVGIGQSRSGKHQTQYALTIWREGLENFKSEIGLSLQRKDDRLHKLNFIRETRFIIFNEKKYWLMPIKKIVKLKEHAKIVYDFSTDNSYFIADGILTHNCWKFIPQKYNNPCKRVVESFIRQGATNQNFILLDSQDMAGVDKIPLKQISTWILGYQAERNEVKHTLDQLPPPKSHRPTEEDIMTLQTGFFYYASRELTTKVYVQPFWLDDETARNVALGKIAVEKVGKMPSQEVEPVIPQENGEPAKLGDETLAYFDKMIGGLQRQITELKNEIHSKPAEKSIDTTQIINSVVAEVIQRIPTTGGNATFQVSPLEKIKKDFLNETKNKLLSDIESVSPDAKRMLKYLEIKGKGIKTNELLEKCFYLKAGGGNYDKMKELASELSEKGIGEYDGQHQTFYGRLRQRLTSMLGNFDATTEEIENVYNHILNDMIGEKLVQ